MSQGGANSTTGSGGASVEFIEGNSGGAVPPDAAFTIDLVGNNSTGIDVVGTPALSLLTILGLPSSTTQVGTTAFATDAETIAGTVTDKAVVPSSLSAKLGSQTQFAIPIGNTTSGALNWTAVGTNGQVIIGSNGTDPVFANLTAGANISISNGPGSITISANGGGELAVTSLDTTDTPYTVVSTDEYLSCDVSAGVLTIELPNGPTLGRVVIVKDSGGDAATNNITVTTVGGVVTIDGATSVTMNTNYEALQFIYTGTSWEVF